MPGFKRRLSAALALLCAASFGVTGLGVPAVAAAPTVQPVTAGPLPTPQVNGIIFSVEIVGNTVYAGGRFSKARPAGVPAGGAGEVTRNNVLAFNLTTGQLLPWAPAVTGTQYTSPNNPGPFCRSAGGTNQWICDTVFRIKASPSGDRIYIGGDFDRVSGQRRTKLAAFDTASGNLVGNFNPTVSSRVRAIAVTDDRVYFGGAFATVNGTARSRLAALSPTGAVQSWAPAADGEVFSMAAMPSANKVLVGGAFNRMNNVARRGLMMVDATNGGNSTLAWRDPSGAGTYTDIVTDGSTAYFGAYDFKGRNPRFEGRAAADVATGNTVWEDGCYGDTQSVAVANGVVYGASHTHDCRAVGELPEQSPRNYWRLTAQGAAPSGTASINRNHVSRGEPISTILPWLPYTNSGPSNSYWKNGTWAVDANSQYVVVGGEFTTVNSTLQQQGLTRFAARGVPGAVNTAPQTPFRAPSVSRDVLGNVNVSWTGTWDRQNWELRYELMRRGTAEPIHTVTEESRSWDLPIMGFRDEDAPNGRVEYWVRAVNADGARISTPVGSVG